MGLLCASYSTQSSSCSKLLNPLTVSLLRSSFLFSGIKLETREKAQEKDFFR